MDERARRVGQNEILFRDVNERVKGINEAFSVVLTDAEFVCECGDATCVERITMPLDEYESLRGDPTHFAVIAGHEVPEVEDVVSEHNGYVVVEKHPGGPAGFAMKHDPRE